MYKLISFTFVIALASVAFLAAAATDPYGKFPTNNVGVDNLNVAPSAGFVKSNGPPKATLKWKTQFLQDPTGAPNVDKKAEWGTSSPDLAVQSVPVLADGNVYFADVAGYLYSYTENGQLNWKVQLKDDLNRPEFFVANPVITQDTIFVAARQMHAINRANGKVRWEKVFDPDLSIHFKDGARWRFQTSQIQLVDNLVVYASSFSDELSADYSKYPWVHGKVAAFNQISGNREWLLDLTQVPDPVIPKPANNAYGFKDTGAGIGSFGGFGVDKARHLLFIGTNNNYDYVDSTVEPKKLSPISDSIIAIDYTTGTLKWYYQYFEGDGCGVPEGVPHCPFFANEETDMDVGGHPAIFTIDGVDLVGAAGKDGTYRIFKRQQVGDPDRAFSVKPYAQFQVDPQASFNLPIGAQPAIKNGIMYVTGSFYRSNPSNPNFHSSTDTMPVGPPGCVPPTCFPDSSFQDAELYALDLKQIIDYYQALAIAHPSTIPDPLCPPGITLDPIIQGPGDDTNPSPTPTNHQICHDSWPVTANLWDGPTYIPQASIVNSSGLTLTDNYIIFGDLLGGIYVFKSDTGKQLFTQQAAPAGTRSKPSFYITDTSGGYGSLPILGGISVSNGKMFVPYGYDYQGISFGNGGVAAFEFNP